MGETGTRATMVQPQPEYSEVMSSTDPGQHCMCILYLTVRFDPQCGFEHGMQFKMKVISLIRVMLDFS